MPDSLCAQRNEQNLFFAGSIIVRFLLWLLLPCAMLGKILLLLCTMQGEILISPCAALGESELWPVVVLANLCRTDPLPHPDSTVQAYTQFFTWFQVELKNNLTVISVSVYHPAQGGIFYCMLSPSIAHGKNKHSPSVAHSKSKLPPSVGLAKLFPSVAHSKSWFEPLVMHFARFERPCKRQLFFGGAVTFQDL